MTEREADVKYDLLVKGGQVLDPGQGLDGKLDIAVADGKISQIAEGIPAEDAARVIEVRGAGRHVVPGLIDLHTHVAHGATTEGVGMGCCHPDSISSDLTALGQSFHSLLECMAKFMAIGYTLADVVKMTTASPAKVLGLQDQIGAIAVGRDADLTILDLIEGDFTFTDTTGQAFRGGYGLVPVHTVRAGESHSPGWGTHPWGWLPESA